MGRQRVLLLICDMSCRPTNSLLLAQPPTYLPTAPASPSKHAAAAHHCCCCCLLSRCHHSQVSPWWCAPQCCCLMAASGCSHQCHPSLPAAAAPAAVASGACSGDGHSGRRLHQQQACVSTRPLLCWCGAQRCLRQWRTGEWICTCVCVCLCLLCFYGGRITHRGAGGERGAQV